MTVVQRLANLRWVAVIIFPLMVVLMEAFWVYPWFLWLGKLPAFITPRPLLSLASVLFLLSISLFVSRFFLSRRWRLGWVRLSIVASGLVTILVIVRTEYDTGAKLLSGEWFVYAARIFLDSFTHPDTLVFAPIVGVYLWWRGITWGRSNLHFEDIYRSFLAGIIALILFTFVWQASYPEEPTSMVWLHVAGFFFFSLTALAMSNFQTVQQKMREGEEKTLLFGRRWLSLLFGLVGGIVLLAMAITSLLSAEFVALLERFLNLAFDGLLMVVNFLLIPLGYVAQGLYYAFQFIINLFRRGPLQAFPSANLTPIVGLPEGMTRQVLSPQAILAIKWSLFALIIAALVFLLARAIFRYRSYGGEEEIEEFHESLWSWTAFKTDLRLFFRTFRQQFEGKRKPATSRPSWHRGGDFTGILNIREIYQHLLWEASVIGIGRRNYETPYEYARRLRQAIPDGSEQLNELTNLYVGIRYGDLKAEVKAIDYANGLWQVLRQRLDTLKSYQQSVNADTVLRQIKLLPKAS